MSTFIRFIDRGLVAPLVALAAWLRRRLPRGRAAAPAGSWVVLKFAGMGDAVLMLPALAALRATGHLITVITTRRCAAILSAPGVADGVIVVDRAPWGRSLRQAWQALRAAGAVLDFEQHVYWTSAAAMLAPRTARRYGLANRGRVRNLAYDTRIEPGAAPRPMKEIFDDLARAAGAHPTPALAALPVEEGARRRVGAWLEEHDLVAGGFRLLAPGSGPSAEFRRMSPRQWADVVDALAATLPVVLAGTRQEATLLADIRQLCRALPLVAQNFSLAELSCLCGSARSVVATDSGPMHLAAAAGVPVVGVFGPDTPHRYGPYNPRSRSVWLGLPCSPCNNCFVYREARCTNPERYACIRNITPAAVAGAALAAEVAPAAAGIGI